MYYMWNICGDYLKESSKTVSMDNSLCMWHLFLPKSFVTEMPLKWKKTQALFIQRSPYFLRKRALWRYLSGTYFLWKHPKVALPESQTLLKNSAYNGAGIYQRERLIRSIGFKTENDVFLACTTCELMFR